MSFDIHVRRRLGANHLAIDIASSSAIVGLFGPSGAGKSSLLNMVAGLLRPDEGRVAIAGGTLFDSAVGVDLPIAQRHCGYIFQDLRLFPHMSVRRNLIYGRRHSGGSALDMPAIVDMLGIGDLLERRPYSLSGGEAQRVAIGRALLANPHFLLMDEPLTGLDQGLKDQILELIRKLHAATSIPILYVSHDRAELEALGADLVSIRPSKAGDGAGL